MAEIAAGVVIGAAVATFITSGGWIAILAAGAISAGMNHYADKIIIEAGDKF